MAPLIDSIPKDLQILVVDDLPSAARVCVRFLTSVGFTNVVTASTVNEAVQKIVMGSIGLVISDLHLKDHKAMEIIELVQKRVPGMKVPFIVMTSDMDKQSFAAALKQGVSAYLLKPFSADALAEQIGRVLVPDNSVKD